MFRKPYGDECSVGNRNQRVLLEEEEQKQEEESSRCNKIRMKNVGGRSGRADKLEERDN
jgi:hypothetical protein